MALQLLAKSGTILFDYPLPATSIADEGGLDKLENVIVSVLKKDFGNLKRVLHQDVISKDGTKNFLRLFIEPNNGVTLTVRTYQAHSLLTATLEYDKAKISSCNYEKIKDLDKEMTHLLNIARSTKAIPEIKRGLKHEVYFDATDGRILEYDVVEMLFDKRSEFQHVQIARTNNYGKMLVLDGIVQFAESDLIYTETLMWRGTVDYTDKNVLILGGGDGGLLNELLKENPRHVTMIELDETVMEACRMYLRSQCGNVLDSYEQEQYSIIVGDCIKFMEKCFLLGEKFDIVFGDLTDIPIALSPQAELWEFILKILKLAFEVLNEGGVYLMHANGISSKESLKIFESAVLAHLPKPVSFVTRESFVPSFNEKWVFYQIKEKQDNA